MKFMIQRTAQALPDSKALEGARALIFGCFEGFGGPDAERAWRKFWGRMIKAEPGELVNVEMVFPRNGRFHRLHMAIEQAVFDAQEQFEDFEQFRFWLKIGAAWVTWAPGPDGGIVPLPKSVSYAQADELEFNQFHESVLRFLHGPRAAPVLWPHLGERAHDQIHAILERFEE